MLELLLDRILLRRYTKKKTKWFKLFLNKSSMHLLICAIHSCFSVLVAAYTANDFVVVRMSHPFLYSVFGIDISINCQLNKPMQFQMIQKNSQGIFKKCAYVRCPLILVIVPPPMVWYVVCCIFSYWSLCYRTQVCRWIEKIVGPLVFCGTFWWAHPRQPIHGPRSLMAVNKKKKTKLIHIWRIQLSFVDFCSGDTYLSGTAEAVFHHIYSASIRFGVHWKNQENQKDNVEYGGVRVSENWHIKVAIDWNLQNQQTNYHYKSWMR